MLNCIICDKELTNGIASAKKENGDYYLMCNHCGNVHYVKALANGLTEIKRTSNEDTPETREAIKEAAQLFTKAGVNIMEFKVGVHSEKKSANELEDTLSKQDLELLEASYNSMPNMYKKMISLENYIKEFKNFEKKVKENPSEMLSGFVKRLLDLRDLNSNDYDEEEYEDEEYDDDDYCDCDNCILDECDNHPSNQEEKSLEDLIKESVPRYIVEGRDKKGNDLIAEADDKKRLAIILADAEENDITIETIHKVNISLTPVSFDIETRYKIND